MGNKDGANKARNYLIEQYGSLERAMQFVASKNKRTGSNGLRGLTHAQRQANGRKYGRSKKVMDIK